MPKSREKYYVSAAALSPCFGCAYRIKTGRVVRQEPRTLSLPIVDAGSDFNRVRACTSEWMWDWRLKSCERT